MPGEDDIKNPQNQVSAVTGEDRFSRLYPGVVRGLCAALLLIGLIAAIMVAYDHIRIFRDFVDASPEVADFNRHRKSPPPSPYAVGAALVLIVGGLAAALIYRSRKLRRMTPEERKRFEEMDCS